MMSQAKRKAVVLLSGGLDSSLVAAIAVDALGKDNVVGVTMPSRYSSTGSVTDAEALANNLGIRLIQVPIEPLFKANLAALSPDVRRSEVEQTLNELLFAAEISAYFCFQLPSAAW